MQHPERVPHFVGTVRPAKALRKDPPGKVAEGSFKKCRHQAEQLRELLLQYDVRFLALEAPHMGAKSARALRAMSMGLAYVAGAVADLAVVPIFVRPLDVKRLVRPRGEVTKDDVREFIGQLYDGFEDDTKENSEHYIDALAVYEFCCMHDLFVKG